LRIEELQEQLGMMSIKTLRPQSIPLNVKVVLIGSPTIFQLLHRLDPDFQELFKVKADFDVEMDNSRENTEAFVSFLASIVSQEEIPELNASGAAKMIEHAARTAGHKEKISTRFGDVADLLREAGYWSSQRESTEISGEDVQRAVDEKIYRSSMIKEKIVELIDEGTIQIDTDASAAGRVNGLSVMQFGDFLFGRPNRITATVAAGQDGVVDIEREAKLGGPVHNKGVLILTGYLQNAFARHTPLSLSARLVFEQSYSGVEGDSASSAELYALLSALADAPVFQGLAVTGSVNQSGDVQAIGGVNEKVEGFFDVCSVKGLTGSQGVVIPAGNVQNLMLREDVVEAITRKQFHIWPVSRIEEGIELLTGIPAGARDESGEFPANSIFRSVEATLTELHEILRRSGQAARGGFQDATAGPLHTGEDD
jgi:lon-related putative ATP-dependent protease